MSADTIEATVFVDADNTLWDTDQVFATAQLEMLAQTETAVGGSATAVDRLAFARTIDQAIAARHHAGLRYPPRLLARALAFALEGQNGEAAARSASSGHERSPLEPDTEIAIEQSFFGNLKRQPNLRPGVRQGLLMLERAGAATLIVSESSRQKVEATAEALGLAGHFKRVIEGPKRPDLYRRALRLTGSPEVAYMIGDQLDRDIAPAKEAGLITIYFPGGFVPKWTPDEAKVKPDFRIGDFEEAATIVLNAHAHRANRRISA